MRPGIFPKLTRKHPVALRRAFVTRFGIGTRALGLAEAGEAQSYRDEVGALLADLYGVPLPPSLVALADGARRRAVPAEAFAAFLGETFDLEPIG